MCPDIHNVRATTEETSSLLHNTFEPARVCDNQYNNMHYIQMRTTLKKIHSFRKYETLSEISREVGLVFFASMFIGPLMSSEYNISTIITGLLLAIISWCCCLSIASK